MRVRVPVRPSASRRRRAFARHALGAAARKTQGRARSHRRGAGDRRPRDGAARVGRAVLPPPARRGDRRGACRNSRAKVRASRALTERWFATEAGAGRARAATLKRAPRQRELLEALRDEPGVASDALARTFEDWRTPMRALVARGFASSAEDAGRCCRRSDRHRAGARRGPGAERGTGRRRSTPSTPRTGASRPSCCTASPAAARPRCTCTRSSTRCGAASARWCWCRRSVSRRSWSGAFANASPSPVAVLHSALTDTERLAAWRAMRVGRGAHRARHALGGVRAGRESRHRHRRRGTRRLVQAARKRLPLFGARPRHPARAARRRAGRARLGDAFARDAAERRERKIHAPVAAAARRPGAAAARRGHRPARARRARRASPRRRSRRCSAISPTTARCWCTSTGAATRRRWPARPAAGSRPAATATRGSPCICGAARLRCHHCGADAPLPENCPQCGYAVQARRPGHGARRGDAGRSCFPACAIARLDRDVVRKRGDLESVVSRIASGEARILVGTQMVTKGHDFPNVTLVVVLNADQGLFSTDFRAPERVAQTIIQVAGRAGRGNEARRGADPDRVSGSSAAARACSTRVTTASRAPRSPNARRRAGRRSRTWPRCAPRRRRCRRPSSSCARRAARGPPRGDLKLLGPAPAAMAKRAGALPRAAADRGARARAAASRCWRSGCRAWKRSRRRATCAGRSTSIRSNLF